MDKAYYDWTHRVMIHVVNSRQILLVPTLGSKCISPAAIIHDFPIDAADLGRDVLNMFTQMEHHNLIAGDSEKKYWLLPKGVRSWNQFQKNSITLHIHRESNTLLLHRYYSVLPNQGFAPESTSPDQTFVYSVPPSEIGSAILEQFDHIQNHPYIPE